MKHILPVVVFSAAVLNGHAQQVEQTIQVGAGVYEIVYNPADKSVYVAAAGSRTQPGGKIYKLSGSDKLAVTDSIDMGGIAPYGLGINTKTQVLYTTNTRDGSVSAIDLKTKKLLATVKNGKEKPHVREVVVDEVNNLVYVSDVGKGSSVWIIDGKTNTYTGSIENTGATTTGIAIDTKNNQLFITNMGTDEIAVIDLKTKKVARSFPAAGQGSVNLVLDGGARKLYVANQKSGTVTILDADKGTLVDSVKTGNGALGIALYKNKQQLVVANRQTSQASIVDARGQKLVRQLDIGTFPNSVAINQEAGVAFITNKAKSARPKEGEPEPPKDQNGDLVSVIRL
ncbi:MAG: YncE family protein [Flavihumibacter sp.]